MTLTLWMTAKQAKEIGCTHHARMCGIIPGFIEPDSALWVSRSDLLNPLEDALVWLWSCMCWLADHEPCFFLDMGKEIEA